MVSAALRRGVGVAAISWQRQQGGGGPGGGLAAAAAARLLASSSSSPGAGGAAAVAGGTAGRPKLPSPELLKTLVCPLTKVKP